MISKTDNYRMSIKYRHIISTKLKKTYCWTHAVLRVIRVQNEVYTTPNTE